MIHKFKIFGFNIWISRETVRVVPRKKNKTNYRSSQRNLRLEMAGGKCEVCGKSIDKRCHIHHTLPAGAENRNAVENIRVMCGECYHELEKKPHLLGYQQLEDTTRYDT